MAENKLGIENFKKGLGFFLALGEETDRALEDKKFDLKDAIGFFDELMAAEPVYQKRLEIIAEAQDIVATERQEINDWAQKEFDIRNDEVEEKVEASVDFMISALKFWAVWRKKPVAPAKPTPPKP